MKFKSRKLISLALTLAMALTLTVPAFAYIPEGKPRPDPTPGQLPGKFNSMWSIDDPYWYTHGDSTGGYESIYTNPDGPTHVYVPDEVQRVWEIENNNMTSISLPKHTIDDGAGGNNIRTDLSQCNEIIIRGLTKEDLARKARLFANVPAKAVPVKNENGEILGWVGGDRSNYKNNNYKYPTIIGGWRLVNMVDQPTDLDTAETVVIPDGADDIYKGSDFKYEDLGIDELKNPNMKVLSVPAGFSAISWRSFDDVPHQLTKIVYRGTEADLIARGIKVSVQFDLFDIRPLSTVIPVEDESGNILGWIGGEYGTDIGGPKKLNLASNKPKPDPDAPNPKSDFEIVSGIVTKYTGPDGAVTIPDGVGGIGPRVFQNRTGITSVKIPASVIGIGDRAFDGCTGITDVYYGGDLAQWNQVIIFDEKGGNSAIYYTVIHCANNTTLTNRRPDTPTTPTGPQAAMPTNDKLTADGMVQAPTVYKINGSNYFKIRDLAAILNGTGKQFSVGYDAGLNAVTATTGQSYAVTGTELAGAASGNSTAEVSNDVIYVDGLKIQVEVYKINGSNYFKLRDLGKALNFYVGWTAARGMFIETGAPYSE